MRITDIGKKFELVTSGRPWKCATYSIMMIGLLNEISINNESRVVDLLFCTYESGLFFWA